jgi:tRNA A37 threonylcarbamoyladenosine modification protein TsaB
VARALVLTLQCRALGIGALEIVAESAARHAAADRPLEAVLDAGRGEVYAQRFASDMRPLTGPVLVTATEFARSRPTGSILVGNVAAKLAGPGDTVLPGTRDAGVLARLVNRRIAAGAEAVGPGDLHPVYVRPPDARQGAGASLLAGVA